jgi:hypothetical protein
VEEEVLLGLVIQVRLAQDEFHAEHSRVEIDGLGGTGAGEGWVRNSKRAHFAIIRAASGLLAA